MLVLVGASAGAAVSYLITRLALVGFVIGGFLGVIAFVAIKLSRMSSRA
jgi:hypothetical protein